MKIIDPSKITEEDLPLTVFACDFMSYIGWRIRSVSGGPYNHVMKMTVLGFFDSQNPGGYKRIPISSYVNDHTKLKFLSYKVPESQKDLFIQNSQVRLDKIKEKKWYQIWNNITYGCYDYLGILGQRFGLEWLQNPLKDFCSEREAKDINAAFRIGVKEHLPPADLNDELKKVKIVEKFGYYIPED